MRKLFWVLVTCALLCGCSREKQSIEEPQDHADYDTVVHYETVDAFLNSDFCQVMRDKEYEVYLPSWDDQEYSLDHIYSDASFYTFVLSENISDRTIIYEIAYETYQTSVEDFAKGKMDISGDRYASVDIDGNNQYVYISKVPYQEREEYNLSYIPFSGYTICIGSDSPTPEEALAYIHDFDLIPASEWSAE